TRAGGDPREAAEHHAGGVPRRGGQGHPARPLRPPRGAGQRGGVSLQRARELRHRDEHPGRRRLHPVHVLRICTAKTIRPRKPSSMTSEIAGWMTRMVVTNPAAAQARTNQRSHTLPILNASSASVAKIESHWMVEGMQRLVAAA